jgi:hypothetical protein
MQGTTTTYSEKNSRLERSKWRSKAEKKLVTEIRKKYQEYSQWRGTSCPLFVPDVVDAGRVTNIDGVKRTGNDWALRWERDYKNWAMVQDLSDPKKSNLKSPMVFAPTEAAIAEFQENNSMVTFSPTEESDRAKVKLYQHLLRHVENKGDFQKQKATSFREDIICGTSFSKICWQRVERNIEVILTSANAEYEVDKVLKGDDQEAIDKVKKRLDKGRPLTKKDQIIEYNDIAYIPISIFEIYVDPSARCLRGFSHEASDMFERSFMSVEQARLLCKNSNDRYIKKENLERIVTASEAAGAYDRSKNPVFDIPTDMESDDQVEVLKYYNKLTDKYIIIANDVIIRDGPLPYNHKQLPFVIHKAIEIPHSLYGMGFGSILDQTMSHDETLMNLDIETRKMNLARPMFINTEIKHEIDHQIPNGELEPGSIIDTSIPLTPDNMQWMPALQSTDYLQIRSTLREDGISLSGINPLSYASPRPNEPVRNNLMSMEATLKMLKKIIKNWAHGDKEAARQIIRLMQQYYPEEYVTRITGEKNDDKKNVDTKKPTKEPSRTIKIKGYRYDEVGGELIENKIDGDSFMQLKSEYLDLTGDIDIEVDVDSIIPVSRALKLQNLQQAMQTTIPILGNPQLLSSPGVLPMLREYLDQMGIPSTVTDQLQDESNDKEAVAAKVQEEKILAGEFVPGIPGESEKHKWQHIQTLLLIKTQSEEMEKQLNDEMAKGADPLSLGDVQAQLEELRKAHISLYEHFTLDGMPKNQSGAAGEMAAPQPPQQAGPPQAPPGMDPAMMSPEMMAMMEQGGMPPADAGGGPPMGAMPVGPM